MSDQSRRLLVSVTPRTLTASETRVVLREIFAYARSHFVIDRIEAEAIALSSLDDVSQQRIDAFIQEGSRSRGRVIVSNPSSDVLELAEQIAPHLMSLNLFAHGELVAGTSDELAALDLVVETEGDWEDLSSRLPLEIRDRLSVDKAELAS